MGEYDWEPIEEAALNKAHKAIPNIKAGRQTKIGMFGYMFNVSKDLSEVTLVRK